jgi:sugar phosphate isomerase/epimerase
MEMTRRDVLKLTAAGLASLGSGARIFGQDKSRKIPISVQLYSVRGDCVRDFDAALEQIAGMGFDGVEFAGYHKYVNDAPALRKKLDALKLQAAATHIRADAFVGDALAKTIDFHKTIGCKFLIVPGDSRFTDPVKSRDFAEFMNKTAEALKPEGLFCGYHNHVDECLKKDGDKSYWDLFAGRTSKEVVLQIDFGHAIYAGVDCVAAVRNSPGRIKTTHVKGRLPKGTVDKKPFVGQDAGDWKAILSACYEVGGTEWFSIEQEDYVDGKSPMECVKISFDGLKKILAEMGR